MSWLWHRNATGAPSTTGAADRASPATDETRRLLAVASNLKVRTLLSLGYGCGLRASEVVRLKVKHIASIAERWLFPGNRHGKPMTTRQLSRLFHQAADAAGGCIPRAGKRAVTFDCCETPLATNQADNPRRRASLD